MSGDRDILAGCDTVLESDGKSIYVNGGRSVRVGRDLGKIKHLFKRRSTTRVGDVVFGCCDDVVIRGGTILYPTDPWFYGKELGKSFTYREEQKVQFDNYHDIYAALPDHCKGEWAML